MKNQIKNLIDQLKVDEAFYDKKISESEEQGIENLSYQDTELFGIYKGKKEVLNDVINQLLNITESEKN